MEPAHTDAILGRLDTLTVDVRSLRDSIDAKLPNMQTANEAEHKATRGEVAGVWTAF